MPANNIPVIFIRKVEIATRNATFLENIEQRNALCHGETVVLAAVDDEVGGVELQDVFWG